MGINSRHPKPDIFWKFASVVISALDLVKGRGYKRQKQVLTYVGQLIMDSSLHL